MARVDDLLDRVTDPHLRQQLTASIGEIRKAKDFGLVFEAHLPETVRLDSHPLRRGVKVARREGDLDELWNLERLAGTTATCRQITDTDGIAVQPGSGECIDIAANDLVVVAQFGDPVYPGLRQVGAIEEADPDQRAHIAINGENHHVLESLRFTHAGRVDCIYIDPPYNTGDTDWRYNNSFVGSSDSYAHSKWLSFMQRRLLLSKELLAEDGILIVTIDEHELHRLGLLLEQIFPGTYQQVVTIVITARGVAKRGAARVEEYALFTYLGDAELSATHDDYLTEIDTGTKRKRSPWASLLRRGTNAAPSDRPGLVYPILIDTETNTIVGTGDTVTQRIDANDLDAHSIDAWIPNRTKSEAWPIRSDGRLGTWQVSPSRLTELVDLGYAKLGRYNESNNSWAVNYLKTGPVAAIDAGDLIRTGTDDNGAAILEYIDDDRPSRRAKTVWRRTAHDAGTYGSSLLQSFLGDRRFDFPKSLYAVHDTLAAAVGSKPDAVVLDFFAGSGTTLHATALLNAADGGNRQCIVVTNNDVNGTQETNLVAAGHERGSAEWEAAGIFHAVTRPRITAAVTGKRPNGTPVPGNYRPEYLDGAPYADGLAANVRFFDLTYEDPVRVEMDLGFNAIAPMLWLRAGGVGDIITTDTIDLERREPFAHTNTYGILFNPDAWQPFVAAITDSTQCVFVVTDSTTTFAQVCAEIPTRIDKVRLYERYLTTFAINQQQGA